MISLIHYIYTLYITEFVSYMNMFTDLMTGLFAWSISRTALSRTYSIGNCKIINLWSIWRQEFCRPQIFEKQGIQ